MADIELVIKISEDSYKATCNGWMLPTDVENVVQGIKNGTPLPKGHGDLIDVDCLREDFKASKKISFAERMDISCIVDHAPTIIEADKESKSKELYTKVKDISENHYYKENNDNSYPGYLCNEDGSVCR